MYKLVTVYAIIHIFFIEVLCGQQMVYQGKVESSDGKPIGGVSVRVTGDDSRLGTTSDDKGSFRLVTSSKPIAIRFILLGYRTLEIVPQSTTGILAVMEETNKELDEVIVQAYGTTSRRLNTGNIAKVSFKEIENQPVSNPLAALSGRVPGMVVTQSSGVPGAGFNIEIRGRTSLDQRLSRNDPLIIIDGVLFEPGNQPANLLRSAMNDNFGNGGLSPLNSINPADIESIEVLKDADATAIYGSRGANGVIIISTKRGRTDRTVTTLTHYTGFSRPVRTMDMLDIRAYVNMRQEGYRNDRIVPSAVSTDPGYAPDIMLWDTTRYTNLKDLLIGHQAVSNESQLSIVGGNDRTRFRIGSSYRNETNVFSRDLNSKRTSATFNLGHRMLDNKLNLDFSTGYTHGRSNLIATDLTQYISLPPNLLLWDDEGNLAWEEEGVSFATVNNISNPLATLLRKNNAINTNLFSNMLLSYTLTSELMLKANFGYNVFKGDELSMVPTAAIDPFVRDWTKASSSFAYSDNSSWSIEPQLTYTKRMGAAQMNALLGMTLQDRQYRGTTINATNFTNDLLLENPAAAGLLTSNRSQSQYRYQAAFMRLNYILSEKYLLNLSFRRDGSSRFGPNNRYANFWAIGSGWIFTEEKWLKDHIPALSFGKLRASYGITGNDQIGDYNYLQLWENNGVSASYQQTPTLRLSKLYNPDFGWEKNKKFEAAVEAGVFKDRLLFSAAYFNNRSSNQLVNYPLPRHVGSSSVVMNLPALVENTGLEFALSSKVMDKDRFSWNTSFNVTFPRNRLISFPNLEMTSYSNTYVEGKALSVINGFRYLGVDPETGVFTFEDVNGDGDLTPADYLVLGDRNPNYYGGLQNTVSLGGFQLDMFFEFRKQVGQNYLAQFYNNIPGLMSNQPKVVLERWQRPGDITDVQQFVGTYATYSNNPAFIAANTRLNRSDAIYSDASFIRLKNISISYALPKNFVEKLHLSQSRCFVNCQNLLTITGYKGSDPETQNFYVLPPLRTVAVGVQLTF